MPVLLLVAALLGIASGCGGDGAGAVALPPAACGPIKYEGEGKPEALIASDFALQGASRALTTEMAAAVEFVLRRRGWKAADLRIGFQSCDDSTAQAGSWDASKCSSNARAYANNTSVIGVIGTSSSGCSKLVIPVLNRAPEGPVPIVSPSNTYVGLTVGGPGTEPGEPQSYYPTGERNYARIVWNDRFQGAANALLAKRLGATRIFVLNDSETYGLGIATLFTRSAEQLGLQVVGFRKWDKNATSYESVASGIRATGADFVFLGGLVCNNGGKLVKDLRAVLGAGVTFAGPDGWTPVSATIAGAGSAANGMYVSQPGIPVDQLTGAGAAFASEFAAAHGGPPEPYAVYAAQATEVLLAAIERSDGSRRAVASQLFDTRVKDGILGDFEIDENGDTTLGKVSFFKIQGGKERFVNTLTPRSDLLRD